MTTSRSISSSVSPCVPVEVPVVMTTPPARVVHTPATMSVSASLVSMVTEEEKQDVNVSFVSCNASITRLLCTKDKKYKNYFIGLLILSLQPLTINRMIAVHVYMLTY